VRTRCIREFLPQNFQDLLQIHELKVKRVVDLVEDENIPVP